MNFVVFSAGKKIMISAASASMKWVTRVIISEWTALSVSLDVHKYKPKTL